MTEWCWLNGKIMPLAEARVSVEDRGFQFADGVYEALRLYDGRPFELGAHLDRLERSCGGIRLPMPMTKGSFTTEIEKLITHAAVPDAQLYIQATRGPSPRSHVFPPQIAPTLLFYIRALPPPAPVGEGKPTALLSVPDERWQRCWIKAIALLPNVLAKNAAVAAGADEAAFVDNGHVTEGSSSNLFMVLDGKLITHPLGPKILPGVTRDTVIDCARKLNITVEERPLRLDEAKRAGEVFVTSSTRELAWVSQWDDTRIGQGACGAVTRRIHEEYRRRVASATARP